MKVAQNFRIKQQGRPKSLAAAPDFRILPQDLSSRHVEGICVCRTREYYFDQGPTILGKANNALLSIDRRQQP